MNDQPQHASLGSDPSKDVDQPVYHVAPRQGWANDGNGFIFYKGRYHMRVATQTHALPLPQPSGTFILVCTNST